MKLFHHNISFNQHDPLDDGLKDAIISEQKEADSFRTLDDTSAEELIKKWSAIVEDIEKDPSWFDFSND